LHFAVIVGGAAVAPMRGIFEGQRHDPVVVSVGLVEMPRQPATKAIKAPHLRKPNLAGDAEVAIAPEPSLEKEEITEEKPEPEKPKEEPKEPEEKPKEDKPKEDESKNAGKPKSDSTDTKLAQSGTEAGTTGSISEGAGGDDIWGVEVDPGVSPYHRRGFASIRNNWRNPAVGPTGRKCIVRFRVTRNGEITDIALEKSSGSQLFDRSAMRAVQMTHSWEQFPRFWKEDEQVIHLEFEYRP
jgi:TonB family protein